MRFPGVKWFLLSILSLKTSEGSGGPSRNNGFKWPVVESGFPDWPKSLLL